MSIRTATVDGVATIENFKPGFEGQTIPGHCCMAGDRSALVDALRRSLARQSAIDAAWEGGSAAFDRADEWSDVDAVAVVADDAVEAVFAQAEADLEALSPIDLRYDPPVVQGYAQRFYRLRDFGEFHIVDLVLIRRSDPLLFREVELHGRGLTWFDRTGVLVDCHLDATADAAAAAARVGPLRAQFEMMQHLMRKDLRRGRHVDALAFYQAYTMRPLVEALRLLHAPCTRIFGMRYLGRDLPAGVVQRIERLAYVGEAAGLAAAHDEAVSWFRACIDRLSEQGPGAGLDGLT